MVNKLKSNAGLTLVETLIAMLILSTATAGVLGSFSYAFKFMQRASKKIEAMNYSRKAQEAFRAIWLANTSGETRLNVATDADAKALFTWLAPPSYGGLIQYTITDRSSDLGSKQLSVTVTWPD